LLPRRINDYEIDIKNSASNFTPTEDEFLIKDSMWPIKNKLHTHESREIKRFDAVQYARADKKEMSNKFQ
jgi:hypothetical protein